MDKLGILLSGHVTDIVKGGLSIAPFVQKDELESIFSTEKSRTLIVPADDYSIADQGVSPPEDQLLALQCYRPYINLLTRSNLSPANGKVSDKSHLQFFEYFNCITDRQNALSFKGPLDTDLSDDRARNKRQPPLAAVIRWSSCSRVELTEMLLKALLAFVVQLLILACLAEGILHYVYYNH